MWHVVPSVEVHVELNTLRADSLCTLRLCCMLFYGKMADEDLSFIPPYIIYSWTFIAKTVQ